ncbi:MAG TPA: hypothetical protein VED40_03885 [Azospirillaceae bacterium]|nr:hypothetical protein [Azospirillaceae bacterium]
MRSEAELLVVRAEQLVAGWGRRATIAVETKLRDAKRQGDEAAQWRWEEIGRHVRELIASGSHR